MDAERFQRLTKHFDIAAAMAKEDRAAYVARLARDDAWLASELNRLLASHDVEGDAFDDARLALPESLLDPGRTAAAAAAPPPERIGRYRLKQILGEGGMGVVYLAEQREPVRRDVALKVIKPGMDSRAIVARFEAERQALALMDHPGVAKILDGGVTERDLPYFVMEYVRGEPITNYCDLHRLSISDRIELFILVCDAVQHAHMRGLIHRDLKPSNILVEAREGKPTPRVIDFGVAKALSGPLAEHTLVTMEGTLLGTPAYMSPEQADGGVSAIDIRADIYSLGAILYELLTGGILYGREQLQRASLAEIQRMIREVEPVKPSSRVTRIEPAEAATIASRRRLDASQHSGRLRGELDWIIMRCLEKDRERRYVSVSALALDLQRALRGEPVSAGPPGAAYRARRFIARNRAAVTTAVAITITLILTTAISIWFGISEAEQRRLVEQRESQLSKVVEFQSSLFRDLDVEAMGRSVRQAMSERLLTQLGEESADGADAEDHRRALEMIWTGISPTDLARAVFHEHILDRAAAALEADFTDQPLVEAALRLTIGIIYGDIGMYDPGDAHIRRAHELRAAALGEEHPDTLRALHHVGSFLVLRERFAEAESILRRVHEGLDRALGRDHVDTRIALLAIGQVLRLQHRMNDAETLLQTALDDWEATGVVGDVHHASALAELGRLAWHRGAFQDAATSMARAHEIYHEASGPEAPATLTMLNDLGVVFMNLGQLTSAEARLADVLEKRRRLIGSDHPHTLITMNNLAQVYRRMERWDEAEDLYRELIELRLRISGPDHSNTLQAKVNLARLLQTRGRLDEAAPILEHVLERRRQRLGPDHPESLAALNVYGGLLQLQGRLAEAETVFRQLAYAQEQRHGPAHRETLRDLFNLASVLCAQKRFEEAGPILHRVIQGELALYGDEDDRPLRTRLLLVECWMADEKPHDAEAAALACYSHFAMRYGPHDRRARRAATLLAEIYERWPELDEAVDQFATADAWRRRALGEE